MVGGFDASGTPTTTAYVLTPDSTTGVLGDWKPAPDALTLPEGRAGSSAVVTADGLLLLGGVGPNGLVNTSLKSLLDAKGVFGSWKEEAPLPTAVADAGAAVFGVFVFVYGGHDANGPTDLVQRGIIATPAAEGLPVNVDAGKIVEWKVDPAYKLPAPRDDAATWFANGTLYLAGGTGCGRAAPGVLLGDPDRRGRDPAVVAPRRHRPADRSGRRKLGGHRTRTSSSSAGRPPRAWSPPPSARIPPPRPRSSSSASSARRSRRCRSAGRSASSWAISTPPGAGTVDFIILLLIGWAFAHPVQAKALIARVTRRR